MIEMFFAVLYAILSFSADLLLRGIIWVFAWLILMIIVCVAYWIFVAPVGWALGLTDRKYERLHKISSVLQNVDMLRMIAIWAIAIITMPLAILKPGTVGDQFDVQIRANRNHEVVDYTELRQYKLLDITNPKHVYASIEDVKSGNTYRQYVSKHCSGKNKLGDLYNIEVTIYHMSDNPDEKYIKFHNLERSFCQ